jgi:hypothetical protein
MARDKCGLEGYLAQYDEPEWRPLLAAVGERLTAGFMWMNDVELDDGSRLHAYKHIHTRAYLYLTEDGRAFERTPCGRYAPQRLDFAIKHALCGWWILRGWEPEDAEAVHEAVVNAQRSVAES